MHQYFTPASINRYLTWLLPVAAIIGLLCFGLGLYGALWNSPPDYQQGEMVRVMYIHVPAAWMALFVYSFMAISSIAYLVWRNPLSAVLARSAAPAGTAFALLCLVTGSLWGKPIWGAWWVWDARLTSMLILFFFYLGYLALADAYDQPERGALASSILSIVGFINVPIVKFSVDFWNTLHQPASLLRTGGSAIHPDMLQPLLLMAAAYFCYFLVFTTLGVKREMMLKRVRRYEAVLFR